MFTSRTLTFLSASFVLYLFANQTQVGWIYVMSALMLCPIVAAAWLNRSSLRGLSAERRVGEVSAEFHEGDEATITLTLSQSQRAGAAQIRLVETCPLAAPDSVFQSSRLFIPSLPAGSSAAFDYRVTIDRRGLHHFPPLAASSRAPFGFFERKQVINLPSPVLIYPEVRPLKRLSLLDKQTAPQFTRQKAGVGYEVLGVRPFRAGDSPRHIHWRSVARTGELVSKEFADEAQPGLTLILDLMTHPYPQAESKHTPFEWGIKAAASIADYARMKNYPLHILADSEALAIPNGPVSWSALMQYLARVQPTGKHPLNQVVQHHPTQAFIAAVLPWPDKFSIQPLIELRRRKHEVLAVMPDPASFTAGGESAAMLAGELIAAGVEVRLLRFGDDWTEQLSGLKEVSRV